MKKQLLIKIAGIAGAVALLSGATFAYFTSNAVTIENVTLASATPSLQIRDSGGWGVVGNNLNIGEDHMYPGQTGAEHKFLLRNVTGGDVPFAKIFPSIASGISGGGWSELKYVVQMRFGETGKGWQSWGPLDWWYTTHTANMLLTDLSDNEQRQFSVQFRMLSTAGDPAQGKNLDFDLSFVAQTP